jgi:hypothetical protein
VYSFGLIESMAVANTLGYHLSLRRRRTSVGTYPSSGVGPKPYFTYAFRRKLPMRVRRVFCREAVLLSLERNTAQAGSAGEDVLVVALEQLPAGLFASGPERHDLA